MFGLKNDEMLICFLLIVVGYCIAKMFSRRCEGFSVGAEKECDDSGFYDLTQMKNCYYNSDTRCYALEGGILPNSCKKADDQSVRTCGDVSGGATTDSDSAWMWDELSSSDQKTLCEGYKYSTGASNCEIKIDSDNNQFCGAKDCKNGYKLDSNDWECIKSN